MDFSETQMEYIHSVDGRGHMSAVEIIGRLETEIAALKADNERMTAACMIDRLNARIAELEAQRRASIHWTTSR